MKYIIWYMCNNTLCCIMQPIEKYDKIIIHIWCIKKKEILYKCRKCGHLNKMKEMYKLKKLPDLKINLKKYV